MAKVARRYFVSGQVQGVGFRHWTVGRARQHGLVGWVRNRRDGQVEVLACGTLSALAKLEAELWGGPVSARVTKVETGTTSDAEVESVDKMVGFSQATTY